MPATSSPTRTHLRRIDHALAGDIAGTLDATDLVMLLRTRVNLTQDEIGRATGVSARSVRNWEHGTVLRQAAEDRLRDLASIVEHLAPTLAPLGISQWLNARNARLDGERALEVLGRGEVEQVRIAAAALTGGDYD